MMQQHKMVHLPSMSNFLGEETSLGKCCEHFQEKVHTAPALGVDFAAELLKWHLLFAHEGANWMRTTRNGEQTLLQLEEQKIPQRLNQHSSSNQEVTINAKNDAHL